MNIEFSCKKQKNPQNVISRPQQEYDSIFKI